MCTYKADDVLEYAMQLDAEMQSNIPGICLKSALYDSLIYVWTCSEYVWYDICLKYIFSLKMSVATLIYYN